ncbi:MAG: heavy-metal-associated domain-containing protein [Rikenellaceae bacterium]
MKKFITFSLALLCLAGVSSASAATQQKQAEPAKVVAKSPIVTTTFAVDVDCATCSKKIMNTIPYEKGVQDVKVNLAKKEVVVKYDSSKTSDQAIIKAFAKIKKSAKVKR